MLDNFSKSLGLGRLGRSAGGVGRAHCQISQPQSTQQGKMIPVTTAGCGCWSTRIFSRRRSVLLILLVLGLAVQGKKKNYIFYVETQAGFFRIVHLMLFHFMLLF